jgi:AAHS family 4-hydroxybenzoate transporter-like MFS transporter
MAASTSVEMLFAFRFVTGLGIGGAMPNAIAMTSEYVPSRIRSLMVVMMFNGFIAGSIAAGLTAARIVEALGWNSVFIVGGVLPLLLAPAILLLLPESVRFLASKEGRQAQVSSLMRRIDPSLAADTRFVLDDHSDARMSVAALFRDGRARRTILLWLLVFCSLLDLFLMTNWLPTQIASLGVSVAIAILISTCLQVGGMIGMVQGWMMDRMGPSRTLMLAYLIAAVAIACIGLVGDNVPLLTVSVLCAGFGIIGGQTAANAVAAGSYPTEIRSTGIGWFLGIGRIGSIVGPSLAGWLLSVGVSNRDVFLLAVIPALCAAAAAFGLGAKSSAVGAAKQAAA